MPQRLGQHFLINKSAIKKIIAALNLQPNDIIIEIGPGKGALTFPLTAECQKIGCKVVAIEKDPELAKNLELGIRNYGRIKILRGDVLKDLPTLIHNSSFIIQNYKVVGNIPYYITGKLLRILSELENKPELTILMIQKEVAQRIVAKPPKMNLLAAAVQFWAEPKILFTLKPADFSPPPEVNSAVIRLTTKQQITTDNNYYKLLHIIFKQPRKTILNNLKTGLKMPKNKIEIALKSLKIDPNSRPQNLSLEQINSLLTQELFTDLDCS
ncbi:MAG: ribosomal RNA small subunit methyltransferase A [Candidatus Harrisonbacteria bacterium]|nr:ribosomal RNA small subunit methyltransferase A [Candidatus Harrisonbacteria bacterium]